MSISTQPPPLVANQLTIIENIPAYIRQFDQFILYRVEPQNGKLLKLPYSAYAPHMGPIDPLDQINQASFATAVAAHQRLDQTQFGLGFVLTPEANVTCFDLDAKDDAAAFSHAVEAMSAPAHATWGETSVSGNGRHYFFVGNTPDGTASMNDVHPNIEIYCSRRFIALTGRALPGAQPDLTDGGGIVAHTFSLRAERRKERIATAGTSPLSGVTYELGRGHMSNERALRLFKEYVERRKAKALAEGKSVPHDTYAYLWQAAPQGTGSERLMQVVGDLDKILADPEQVYQIIESSPLGQSRCNSLYRKFHKYWLPDARGGLRKNTEGIWNRTQEEQAYLAAHGAKLVATCRYDGSGKLMDGFAMTTKEQMEADAADEDADAEELAERKAKASDIKTHLLAVLGTRGAQPSPAMSAYIDANTRAMKTPHRGFATFATIAFTSALCGLNYRTQDNLTTTLFHLLVAPSGGGKGQAASFWLKVYSAAYCSALITKGLPASPQSLHMMIQSLRVCVNYTADAGSDVESVAKPVNVMQREIRDRIADLFDCSEFGQMTVDPKKSLTGDKRGDRPVTGARYSPIWLCTPKAFDRAFDLEAVLTGFGSRALIDVLDEDGGEMVPRNEVNPDIPQHLIDWVERQFVEAIGINNLYNEFDNSGVDLSKADRTVAAIVKAQKGPVWEKIKVATWLVPYTTEADALLDQIESRQNDVGRAVRKKRLHEMFTVYARLSMLTKKLALLDAVIGKTGPCMITVENVAWGASRAIDCLSSLVRHFENGGGNSADDAKRGDKIIEWIGVKGTNMSLSRLADRAAMNSMFANHPFGSNEALLRTLRFLELSGRVAIADAKRGKKVTRLR